VDANKDVVFRLRPRENPQSQGYFMCDEGRHGYHHADSAERIERPHVRRGDKLVAVPYLEAAQELRNDFETHLRLHPGAVWAILSPFLTVEEAYLAAKWLKGKSKQVKLALGFVPVVGEDDTYPKDRRGRPIQPVKFTIRAEKPNDLMLAVTDIFHGTATTFAKYVFPATTFSEKEGVYVNYAGLAQALHRACKPPLEGRSEGQFFMDLAGRSGLFNAAAIRNELAAEISYFAKLADGVPELGVKLV